MVGWTQTDLAQKARVARQTLVDFERGARTPFPNNIGAIRSALEAAGVEFIATSDGRAGVLLAAPVAESPAPMGVRSERPK